MRRRIAWALTHQTLDCSLTKALDDRRKPHLVLRPQRQQTTNLSRTPQGVNPAPQPPETEETPVTETLRNRATSRRLIPLIAAAITLSVGAGAAHAQSIGNLSIAKGGTNSADEVQTSNPRYQRTSAVAVQSSTSTSFTTRYSFLVAADYDGF